MYYGINFNGVSNPEWLIYQGGDRPIFPTRRKREVSVLDRDGTYDFENEKYDKRNFSLNFTILADDLQQLRQRARWVGSWLKGKGRLIFGDEIDKYYIAKVYSFVSLGVITMDGEFSLQFEAQPFAYFVQDVNEVIDWNNTEIGFVDYLTFDHIASQYSQALTGNTTFTVDNFGSMPVKPIIELNGNLTNINITINSKTFTYSEALVSELLTINNDRFLVKTTINKINSSNAIFLELLEGDNEVTITGTDLNCDITFKFNTLFI